MDNDLLVGDGDDASATTLKKTLTTSKIQETTKVYLPALSYGRIPHVLNDKSDAGNILRFNPVALPVRFYKTLEGVSECQITYKGDVFVDFFLDGEQLGDTYQFDAQYDGNGKSIYGVRSSYSQKTLVVMFFSILRSVGMGTLSQWRQMLTHLSLSLLPRQNQDEEKIWKSPNRAVIC